MVNLDIDEIGREEGLLIRSCRVKINGNTIITPTRTIGTTLSNATELQLSKPFIRGNFRPFGEVYSRLSLNDIEKYIKNDEEAEKFCSKLTHRVYQLKQAGALPYVLFSITDNNENPLNRLLPQDAQKFIFDVLWGIPGNSIIATPLLGTLQSADEYTKMIDEFHKRQVAAIDRKNQPIMAIVPSSYSLIDPKLIERYWNYGIRIFGYNCENKRYGSYSPIIERLHVELSELSKKNNDNYILNGINSKYRHGKESTRRIHNLIGAGFGFDTYSPNHVLPKFIMPSGSGSVLKRYIFNDSDYGFQDIDGLEKIKDDAILNTVAFKSIDLSDLKTMTNYGRKKVSTAHDIEKTIKEISQYPKYISGNELFDYLSSKEKIKAESLEIGSFKHHIDASDEWYA